MKYTVGLATEEDIKRILPYTTENAKVDWQVIRDSNETRVFFCDGEPIMILGLVYMPSSDDVVTAALWGLFREDVHKHSLPLVRVCKDLLFTRVGYRFVVFVDEDESKFKRFAQYFGFVPTKDLAELDGKLYRYYIQES